MKRSVNIWITHLTYFQVLILIQYSTVSRTMHSLTQFFILCIIPSVFMYPLIVDDTRNVCRFKVNKKSVLMMDHLWTTSIGSTQFHFSFCRTVPPHICGKEAVACITKTGSDNIYFKLSGVYAKSPKQNITLTSESNCEADILRKVKIHVIFHCLDPIKDIPEIIKKNNCEYELRMMAPSDSVCKFPQCTMNLFGQLLDLRPLKGVYHVQARHYNFSIALCQENVYCNETDITACIISSGSTEPLASKSNEIMLYKKENNQVYIHSSYKHSTQHYKKQFELITKCNWNKLMTDIQYIEPYNQGSKYKFYMETLHACVKVPPECQLPDMVNNNLFYNLSTLYNQAGYWDVQDAPNPIYLNICGPLKLKPGDNKNNCSKSYSQVCKIENGKYVNLGSLQKKFTIFDGVISTKFEAGDICQQNGKTYETFIEFKCSNLEQGPKYLHSNNCGIFMTWNTPAACSALNNNITCGNTTTNANKCKLEYGGYLYDLTNLTKQDHYIIHDNHSNTEYMLNICASVVNQDIPCTKEDMVVVKYINEVDYMKRWKFLGKMSKISVMGHRIAIETSHGSFCNTHPYSSVIYLECSRYDEYIHLINKTDCHYEFLFKTKTACPNPLELSNNCSFRNPFNTTFTLNLAETNLPIIKINYGANVYVFNICHQDGHRCRGEEHCTYAAVKQDLFIVDNKMYLDFFVDKSCSTSDDFNRTLIEMVCSPIKGNDHYTLIGRKNCILYLKLTTNLVCLQQVATVPSLDFQYQNKSNYEISEELNTTIHSTIIKNPYTDYLFDIVNYKIQIKDISHKYVAFSYGNHSVIVNFITRKKCLDGELNNYEYHITIYCETENVQSYLNTSQVLPCLKTYTLRIPEGCKLLERNTISTSGTSITLSVMGTLLLLCLLGTVGFIANRIWKRRLRYQPYQKEGDL